jgi:hypothetical protein
MAEIRIDAAKPERMSKSGDILSNAERLISDATHMHAEGRSRSAATLIVVALEQLGAFVEALTRETYPEAVLHIGIFGDRANAHAKRQDALGAHVLNYVMGLETARCLWEEYFEKTRSNDADLDTFLKWLRTRRPIEFSAAQQERQRNNPDIVAANALMRAVSTHRSQHLREYGLYENVARTFSDASVGEIIELAARVREILSRAPVLPETMQIAGINMPTGLIVG